MCGITGFIDQWDATKTRSADERAQILDRMCRVITHRGPDDQGVLVQPGVALGMRRLSIIDLSGGHQPISNEDGTVTIVFNGEVYNHHALRAELRARHDHKTRSDTEVLVHLYEEGVLAMVNRLRGMFAFAVWDDKLDRLFIARDRLGIKPLYYWETEDGVAFCSELKSLLVLEHFPRELDVDANHEYLALGYVPDPACIFKGVRKLPPGHVLTWDAE